MKLTTLHRNKIIKFMGNVDEEGLEFVYTQAKKELINRGKYDKNNNAILNFTSNTTHNSEEQRQGLNEMFSRAWIHG